MSDADMAKLNRLATVAKPNSPLKSIIAESLEMVKKVNVWSNVATSGTAICSYDTATGKPRTYELRYQFGDTGNLVHELTHIAVNEAFNQDFVNYKSAAGKPPAPEYDKAGRRTNQADRQGKWMNDAGNSTMSLELNTLLGLATGAGMPPQQMMKVVEKLRYGLTSPHLEHDTVLNQIMIWMFEWGYPALVAPGSTAPGANNFYAALEKAAQAAHARRNS